MIDCLKVYFIIWFIVVFVQEQNGEQINDHFILSDSVALLKDYLSRKWLCHPETLVISLSGQ